MTTSKMNLSWESQVRMHTNRRNNRSFGNLMPNSQIPGWMSTVYAVSESFLWSCEIEHNFPNIFEYICSSFESFSILTSFMRRFFVLNSFRLNKLFRRYLELFIIEYSVFNRRLSHKSRIIDSSETKWNKSMQTLFQNSFLLINDVSAKFTQFDIEMIY